MGHLGGDINAARKPVQGIQVFGKTLPLPANAFVQGSTGNILDIFHHRDHRVASLSVGFAGGKPDTAIAHH